MPFCHTHCLLASVQPLSLIVTHIIHHSPLPVLLLPLYLLSYILFINPFLSIFLTRLSHLRTFSLMTSFTPFLTLHKSYSLASHSVNHSSFTSSVSLKLFICYALRIQTQIPHLWSLQIQKQLTLTSDPEFNVLGISSTPYHSLRTFKIRPNTFLIAPLGLLLLGFILQVAKTQEIRLVNFKIFFLVFLGRVYVLPSI